MSRKNPQPAYLNMVAVLAAFVASGTIRSEEPVISLRQMLDQPVRVDFDSTPLTNVIADFHRQTGIAVVIDSQVPGSQRLVSLKSAQMKLGNALDWVCALADVHAVIGEHEIVLRPGNTGRATAGLGIPPPAPDNAAVEKQLDQKVSVLWTQRPLMEAVHLLRRQTNVPFILDPKVVSKEQLISLQVENLALRDVLTSLCQQTGSHFVIRDEAVCLFSGKAPAEGSRK